MSLIALSASYGAGGSRIGPALAERLGVPFVDRAVPLAVAARLDVDVDEAEGLEGQPGASLIERMLHGFIGADSGAPLPPPAQVLSPEDFRAATEQILREQAATGNGVILGRGAAFVLRDDARVLRVRLDGPAERRITQAMHLEQIDHDTARRGLARLDRAHAAYARQFYGADIADPAHYHLVLDSTALPIDVCIELILTAARAHR